MDITLYDSLKRQKVLFKPIKDNRVGIYVCGVTVYDDCHIGHARAYVVFDLWRRLFEQSGYDVRFVQNFTDIDDKIIARALERNISTEELTATTIKSFFEDMDALAIKRATVYPKATDSISDMHELIQRLLDNGSAYCKDGTVFFSVASKSDYGKLSHKVIEDLQSGARVDINVSKRNPLDFVLWKPAKEGEPSWPSPWGDGRPGWHIECSAMAMRELGETIDIHAGGADLLFPHHENEIAQSECATGKVFANYWLHNGFVTIKDEKMAKSKNNFFTIKEVLKSVPAPVLRFFLMRVHYRAPLNFSKDAIDDAHNAFMRLQETVRNNSSDQSILTEVDKLELCRLQDRVWVALADDLNTSDAVAVLFELSKLINKLGAGAEYLIESCQCLGLDILPKDNDIPDDIVELVNRRQDAKANRDFALADQLRDEIVANGYSIKDTPDGPIISS